MTTGFPVSAVLIEARRVHEQMMKVQVQVKWSPRTDVEADALANGDHRAFDPAPQVHADSHSLV